MAQVTRSVVEKAGVDIEHETWFSEFIGEGSIGHGGV